MWRCTVCNWIYDEEVEGKAFSDLPEDYTCPVCGAPKSAFEPVLETLTDDQPSVADALVQGLVDMGVSRVYGIPGDSNLPLIEAIRANGSIDLITTRHEHAAAFMASGHAKLTGQLGVCISIAGPGATNLITGLMDAASDRAPVLALVGQVPELFLGSEAFQEIDQIGLFRSFAAFAETVGRPSQLPRLLGLAIKKAYGAHGVSVLSLPTDVLTEAAVDERWDHHRRLFRPAIMPSSEDLARAADLINEARAPAILAGWGSRCAADQVGELARKLRAPLATTSRAKGIVPETESLSVGVLGSIGNPHAPGVLLESDLLLVLGSGFRQHNLLPGIPVVQLDHDPVRVGRNFPVSLGLVGDVPRTLSALLPLIEPRDTMSPALEAALQQCREKWMSDLKADRDRDGDPVHPGYLIQTLKRHISPDAVVTVDVGDHTYWFYKRFLCEGQVTLMSASLASMGFALPAAVASQFELPDRQVVAVTGDGGFAMVMGDFTTAVQHQLPLKVIVFNDGLLKNIMKEQNRDGYPEYGVRLVNPDFASFAQSTGAMGLKVESGQDLESAIAEAFAYQGPALIDVVIDGDAMLPGAKRITPL